MYFYQYIKPNDKDIAILGGVMGFYYGIDKNASVYDGTYAAFKNKNISDTYLHSIFMNFFKLNSTHYFHSE
jgi:hypothetical protein